MSANASPPSKKSKNIQTSNTDRLQGIEKKLDDMKADMDKRDKENQEQLKLIAEALAEQNGMLPVLLAQKTKAQALISNFPIDSGDKLIGLNNDITKMNRDTYIEAMTSLIGPAGIEKNLKNILSDEVTLDYNIGGVHGKNCLKKLENFYSVLIESIPTKPGSSDSKESFLRKAMQLQKKRYFKKVCLSKNTQSQKQPE